MIRFPVEARRVSLTPILKTYDLIEVAKPCVKSVYCITGYIIWKFVILRYVTEIFESLENWKSKYFSWLNVNQKRNIADKKVMFSKTIYIAYQCFCLRKCVLRV